MNSLPICLIQASLHWEDIGANLEMFAAKLETVQPGTVVFLPEMFSTGFSMQPEKLAETMEGATISWMRQLAKSHNIILAGSAIIAAEGHYYNRLIWMQPDGGMGWYDKRHLFGYAGEDQHYSAGEKRLITSVGGWKLNLMVCYDLRFPVWSRQQLAEEGQPEYDILVYLANWPERRNHAWKTLLQARAIENQCYVIGVNRVGADGNDIYHSGDSMVIDPMGEVLFTKAHEEIMHTQLLDKLHLDTVRRKLPFLRDGDLFAIVT